MPRRIPFFYSLKIVLLCYLSLPAVRLPLHLPNNAVRAVSMSCVCNLISRCAAVQRGVESQQKRPAAPRRRAAGTVRKPAARWPPHTARRRRRRRLPVPLFGAPRQQQLVVNSLCVCVQGQGGSEEVRIGFDPIAVDGNVKSPAGIVPAAHTIRILLLLDQATVLRAHQSDDTFDDVVFERGQ